VLALGLAAVGNFGSNPGLRRQYVWQAAFDGVMLGGTLLIVSPVGRILPQLRPSKLGVHRRKKIKMERNHPIPEE
jgi:hypothetical protein